MQKIITILFFICIAFACKKKCDPTYPVAGLWEGTYTVNGTPGSFYYSLTIKPDGRIITDGRGADGNLYYSNGTWQMNGTTLTYVVQPFNVAFQQTGTLIFSDDGTLTLGTWQDIASPSMSAGTFPTMKRVN
jgi:hypothetical protein